MAVRGTKSPSRSNRVRAEAGGSRSVTRTTPRCAPPFQASSRPRASNAAESPVSAACTTGRPVSAARSALSEACWASAQLPWNVASDVW